MNPAISVTCPGASKYFVITVLEVANDKDKKAIEKAVERTLKNKLHKKRSLQTSSITELKAVIKALPLETASTRMTFVLDKRMGGAAMHEFNELLRYRYNRRFRLKCRFSLIMKIPTKYGCC